MFTSQAPNHYLQYPRTPAASDTRRVSALNLVAMHRAVRDVGPLDVVGHHREERLDISLVEERIRAPENVLVRARAHHERPSFTLADTTFHFIDATPAEALRQAQEAARGMDVRLGGGVTTIREFLEADLVDTMHIAVAPTEFGRGERLWSSHTELLDRFHLDSVPSPSGVTHLLFWRR
jgi:riboflavin biosynthesis pyrimidine reductase